MVCRRFEYREEPVSLDPETLAARYREDGEAAAEIWLGQALERMAFALARVERLRKAGRLDACAQTARELERLARACGLTRLSRVAASVSDCARCGDETALAATAARLSRVGDRSLSVIWDAGPTQ